MDYFWKLALVRYRKMASLRKSEIFVLPSGVQSALVNSLPPLYAHRL